MTKTGLWMRERSTAKLMNSEGAEGNRGANEIGSGYCLVAGMQTTKKTASTLIPNWILAFGSLLLITFNVHALDCDRFLDVAAEDHICESPDLRAADDLLNELFNQFRHSPQFTPRDLMEQRRWLKEIRNPCEGSHLCLEAAYSLRLEEIALALMKTSKDPLVEKEKNKIKIFYGGKYRSGWGDQNKSRTLYRDEKGELYTGGSLAFPNKGDSDIVQGWYSLDRKKWFPSDHWRRTWKSLKWDSCLDIDDVRRPEEDKSVCEYLAWGQVDTRQAIGMKKCPLGNRTVSIVVRWQNSFVSYRVILGSAYPIIFENTGCGLESLHPRLPGYLPGYSKRRFYEAEGVSIIDLQNGSFLLSVADMVLKYPYDFLSVNYPGVVFIEEQKLESLKLKLWRDTESLGNEVERIKSYDAALDRELAKLFP